MHGTGGIQHTYFVGKPSSKKQYWKSAVDAWTTIKQILQKYHVRV
jgi:hypothetical protein